MACHLSWLRPRAFGLLQVAVRVCAFQLVALGELLAAIAGFAVVEPVAATAVSDRS